MYQRFNERFENNRHQHVESSEGFEGRGRRFGTKIKDQRYLLVLHVSSHISGYFQILFYLKF